MAAYADRLDVDKIREAYDALAKQVKQKRRERERQVAALIFAFAPKGEVKAVPVGSTPIDFAFSAIPKTPRPTSWRDPHLPPEEAAQAASAPVQRTRGPASRCRNPLRTPATSSRPREHLAEKLHAYTRDTMGTFGGSMPAKSSTFRNRRYSRGLGSCGTKLTSS